MTSSNRNITVVTGPLWGEFVVHRWIPLTKASDAGLWCYLWYTPEQTVEKTIETPGFKTSSHLLWRHCNARTKYNKAQTVCIIPGMYCASNILHHNYNGVIMSAMAPQISSLTIVHSTAYSGADRRKHQISAPLAFVRGIHRWPVNSPHKWPVTRKMFPLDDVIVSLGIR